MEKVETKYKAKLIPVRVISAQSDNALVEFTMGGIFQRATIPTAELEGDKAPDDVLIAGIPYGVPWEFVELSASPIVLANTLRANGVWTYQQAISSPNKIVAVLQTVYGVDLAALLNYARENK